MRKTCIIGADGYIGRYLLEQLRQTDPTTIGTSRRPGTGPQFYLDFTNPDVRALKLSEHKYQDAIIAGGIPKIRVCEQDPSGTRDINVRGTIELARQLCEEGIRPIFLSTDSVFGSGAGGFTEATSPSPVNQYGSQKVEVEQALPGVCGSDFLIFRLSVIYSRRPGDGTIIEEIANCLSQSKNYRAARDQVFCPTLIDDLPGVFAEIQNSDLSGVFHVCAPDAWDRYSIAIAVARGLGLNESLVESIRISDLGDTIKRPTDMSMEPRRLKESGMVDRFTALEDSIKEFAAAWASAGAKR